METMTMTGQNTSQSDNFTPLQTEASYTHDELLSALLFTQDILERAIIPFVLLDDLAKQIYLNQSILELPEISLGIKQKHLTESGRSILHMLLPRGYEWTKVNIFFHHNNVPVIIWIVERDLSFLKNPDVRFFTASEFYIPNPFRLYWKERDLVR